MRPPHHLHIRTVWEHSPTREKIIEMATIKDRGAVRICVIARIYLPRPTNPWALHLPTSPTTWHPSRASTWTRVASCHVSAPPTPRVGHTQPCHVASVPRRIRALVSHTKSAYAHHVIRGVCGIKKPPFRNLNKKN